MSKVNLKMMSLRMLDCPPLPACLRSMLECQARAMAIAPKPTLMLQLATVNDLPVWHYRGGWHPTTHLIQLSLLQQTMPEHQIQIVVREANSLEAIRCQQAACIQSSLMLQPFKATMLRDLQQELLAQFALPPTFQVKELQTIFRLNFSSFYKKSKSLTGPVPSRVSLDTQIVRDMIPDCEEW